MNQIDLSHRHAIVTGGAQGIGLAIARRFLASGASVTLWDRDGELLASAARELGALGAVDSVMTDVTQAESIAAAAASGRKRTLPTRLLRFQVAIRIRHRKCTLLVFQNVAQPPRDV